MTRVTEQCHCCYANALYQSIGWTLELELPANILLLENPTSQNEEKYLFSFF